jgi:hypothetical protein
VFRRFRLSRCLLILAAVQAASACGSSPSAPSSASSVLTGSWGGADIALTVADSSSHVDFDCAQGDIPGPLTVNTRNQFNLSGTFIREHGGPIAVGEVADSHPAVYFGSVTAATMSLTVRLTDTGEEMGPFTLLRGSAGRVVRCLLPVIGV